MVDRYAPETPADVRAAAAKLVGNVIAVLPSYAPPDFNQPPAPGDTIRRAGAAAMLARPGAGLELASSRRHCDQLRPLAPGAGDPLLHVGRRQRSRGCRGRDWGRRCRGDGRRRGLRGSLARALSLATVETQTRRTAPLTPCLLPMVGRALCRSGQIVFDPEVTGGPPADASGERRARQPSGSGDRRRWVYTVTVDGPGTTHTTKWLLADSVRS